MSVKLLTTDSDKVVHRLGWKQWFFPAGELGIQLDDSPFYQDENMSVAVVWEFENQLELVLVANLIDAILEKNPDCLIDLLLPYMPYSRQDRVCHPGESNAMRVFASLLNGIKGINVIVTIDLHNEEVLKYFEHQVLILEQQDALSLLPKYDYLIAPDAGAAKKINKHRQTLSSQDNPTKVIVMDKTRVNGTVVHSVPELPDDFKSSKVCVVDDICDGGATFISIAKTLEQLEKRPAKLDLAVSHGFFSKGVDVIKEKYDTIYTANLMSPYKQGVVQLMDKWREF